MSDPDGSILTRMRRDGKVYAVSVLPVRKPSMACIVTAGRTGSTLLVELLDSQPEVFCDDEIFGRWRDLPKRFVDGRARWAKLRGHRLYGFKVNTLYLSQRFLSARPRGGVVPMLERLGDRGCVFIHLRRRNVLRQAVSALRRSTDGNWARSDADLPRDKLKIDPADLIGHMSAFDTQADQLGRFLERVPSMSLTYEDDLASPEAQRRTVEAICSRFDLEARPPRSTLRKVGKARLADDIANYDEVAEVVGRTRFAVYLDD